MTNISRLAGIGKEEESVGNWSGLCVIIIAEEEDSSGMGMLELDSLLVVSLMERAISVIAAAAEHSFVILSLIDRVIAVVVM